jgi:hypothetical protein
MQRLTLIAAPLAALALIVAAPAFAGPGSPTAGAAKTCHLSTHDQRHLGTTYVFFLSVKGTKCSNGTKVAKAFNECRHAGHKRSGKCGHKVFGYRCSERRYNKSPLSYDSKVTCRKGSRSIVFRYTQNT